MLSPDDTVQAPLRGYMHRSHAPSVERNCQSIELGPGRAGASDEIDTCLTSDQADRRLHHTIHRI